MTVPSTLDTVPPEVLEHIAFLSATDNLLGPPSGLIPLLLISRSIYSRLSIHLNHHLYARIYAFKFDVKPIIRRLGPESTTAYILSKELPRRFQHLKRIRGHLHCLVQDGDADDDPMLTDMILSAYSLMLENEGMNEKQLRDYAKIDSWLKDYWFHEHGASRVPHYLRVEDWLPENHSRSMAMWLLWFLFNEKDYTKDDAESWNALNILKTFALGAHKYELTYPEWYYFVPRRSFPRPEGMEYLSSLRRLAAPPLATPAILSYLTLANKLAGGADNKIPLAPSPPSSRPQHKLEWEREWHRCVNLGQGDYSSNILTESFLPGSVDGVWEGLFTYTEFTAYASVLAGGNPQVIQRSIAVRHRQTWKLREYHLLTSNTRLYGLNSSRVEPLPGGDPLRSYFPTGTQIREVRGGIEVQLPHQVDILFYRRASTICGENGGGTPVLDIIITGEGHSAWGQFNLVGRVRPCDGFISLSKEYVDGDRGKWLYRGYLVGNANTNLAGRWRDTLTPTDSQGYEGCFAVSRRPRI